jgi:hypothetical protein
MSGDREIADAIDRRIAQRARPGRRTGPDGTDATDPAT